MSRMLSKMNLISVVQQLPKEDIETIQGYVEMIEEENQELKQKYLNAVADYETTMAEKEQLKKQVEEALKNYEKEAYIVDKQTRQLTDEYKNTKYQSDKVNSLLTQQKEFIKYLEDEIKIYSNTYMGEMLKELKEILQKYKSIIGGKDV